MKNTQCAEMNRQEIEQAGYSHTPELGDHLFPDFTVQWIACAALRKFWQYEVISRGNAFIIHSKSISMVASYEISLLVFLIYLFNT